IRRIERKDFASLEVVITGAEKLPRDVADAFEEKFGTRPLEGYGTTELSPTVCCNIPPERVPQAGQVASREGSIGQTFNGISAKIVDLDTDEDLGTNRAGMLLVTGPNVMKGYLHKPELTAEVIRDGWYVTGDMAKIDDDGFIFITGRISRFSKIGGEMVPHIGVEEAIVDAMGLDADELSIAVTSVPDPGKGERLIVLYTNLPCQPVEICQKLREAGLPAIWVPSPDAFRQVDEIPVLGTGKLALKEIKDLALEITAEK
ncbi:MAG: AMP-binding protein, partial [Pirellulales bacterium]|nr:AMP-binding protein [Pirellulales bacterium]